MTVIKKIVETLRQYRIPLDHEKFTQEAIKQIFEENEICMQSEYRLSDRSIIDFYDEENRIGLEIKLKGSSAKIYDQCKRYCEFSAIDCLVLVTRKTMGMPEDISGKKVYVVSLGEAWL